MRQSKTRFMAAAAFIVPMFAGLAAGGLLKRGKLALERLDLRMRCIKLCAASGALRRIILHFLQLIAQHLHLSLGIFKRNRCAGALRGLRAQAVGLRCLCGKFLLKRANLLAQLLHVLAYLLHVVVVSAE